LNNLLYYGAIEIIDVLLSLLSHVMALLITEWSFFAAYTAAETRRVFQWPRPMFEKMRAATQKT